MRIGRRPLQWGAVIVTWAVALAVRAAHFKQWPLGFRPTLEFDSANAARTIYLTLTSDHTAGWQQAWLAAHPGRFIEPPLLQTLTALTYLPGGVERPWTAAVFTAIFWFAAAAFLFRAVLRLTGRSGATLGTGYLLLAPFAVAVSQSFQPEALLVLGLALVIWYSVRGDVTDGRLVVAATLGGFAGLTKPGVLLPIIAALFVWSAAQGGPLRDWRRGLRLVAVITLAALPAIAYTAILLPNQVGQKVLLGLLLTPGYYTGWISNVIRVVGIVPLIGGILGFVLAPRLRWLGLALGAGYLVDSVALTWHTMTHDYYQVPLLVMIAIGLGGLGEVLVRRAMAGGPRWASGIATGFGIAVLLTFLLGPPDLLGATPGRYPDRARLEAIGRLVGAGEAIIAYSENYGLPLMYYGKVLVTPWPDAGQKRYEVTLGEQLNDDARLQQLLKVGRPHYFAITVPWAPALVDILGARYPVVANGPSLRIYDLTRPLLAGETRVPSREQLALP